LINNNKRTYCNKNYWTLIDIFAELHFAINPRAGIIFGVFRNWKYEYSKIGFEILDSKKLF